MSCETNLDTISVYRANDKTFRITITKDGLITVAGWTIWFTVKSLTDDSSNDTDAIIAKTGIIDSPTVAPQAYISLSDSDTDKPEGSYQYDIKIKDDQGNLQNSASGVFKILPRVTIRST